MAKFRARPDSHTLLIDLKSLEQVCETSNNKLLHFLEELATRKGYLINFISDSFYANAEEVLSEVLLSDSNTFTNNATSLYMCDQLTHSNLKGSLIDEIRQFDNRHIIYFGHDSDITTALYNENYGKHKDDTCNHIRKVLNPQEVFKILRPLYPQYKAEEIASNPAFLAA